MQAVLHGSPNVTCMLNLNTDSQSTLFQGGGTTGGGGGGVPAEFSVRQGRVPHTINEGRIKTVQGSSVTGLLLAERTKTVQKLCLPVAGPMSCSAYAVRVGRPVPGLIPGCATAQRRHQNRTGCSSASLRESGATA